MSNRYPNSSHGGRNCDSPTWLWPVKFALEGTVASEVGIPGLSHIPGSRSCMEQGIEGTKEWVLLVLSKPPVRLRQVSFDSDRSATHY
jgi:hypothetical protein